MARRIERTEKRYLMHGMTAHFQCDTVYACGAVFGTPGNYRWNTATYGPSPLQSQHGKAHTQAWAERMVRKHLGGAW